MSQLNRLVGRQLLVVTGKGGVGKSLVSAGVSRLAAAAGRRVLLLEVDPRETQNELAGVPPSGGEMVRVRHNLLLQNLQPRRVFEAAVREHVPLEFVARRVLRSPLFQHFTDTAPGIKELAILGHALRVIRGIEPTPFEQTDLVVLDAPATGHSVSLLAAPRMVAEVVDAGPFARLAHELARFVGDAAATGIVVVTMAEDMAVQEALELRQALADRVGREPDLLAVNSVYPPVPPGQGVDASRDSDRQPGPLELWRRRRAINDRELRRLRERWAGPQVVLPLIPEDRGPALLEALLPVLRLALEGVA